MTVSDRLTDRNATFASERFVTGLKMMPSDRTVVIGCIDPRVEPVDVLGAEPGEVAVLRNVGGRVTHEVILELQLLREVVRSAGGELGGGWEIAVLHHTACGIARVGNQTAMLEQFFGASAGAKALADPHSAVALDVQELVEHSGLSGAQVSGHVYDVDTGLVETVVAPIPIV